jgi:hypothetical protein
VRNNEWLVSLDFLASLQQVDNLVIENNAALVDARLGAAVVSGDILVSYNGRLCDARSPGSTSLGASECVAIDIVQLYTTSSHSQADQVQQLFEAALADGAQSAAWV